MIKAYHFIAWFIIICSIQACTERVICPAYQSAFIHDKAALDKRFSYFKEDSTPKVMEASKDKFLIIEPVSYKKKLRSLQTIPMREVYPETVDSLEFRDEFYLAERDVYDSSETLGADSANSGDDIYVISIKKEKFNIDQELYLWYLREYLVYPDVRLQMQANAELKKVEKVKEAKKGISGFFNRIFKKKNKSDSTIFDIETSATKLDGNEVKKKKKDPFGFLKKDGKEKSVKEEKSPKEKKQNQEAVRPTEVPDVQEDDGEDDF